MDRNGREVDFVVQESDAPLLMVECKLSDTAPDTSLRYLKSRFPRADAWQLVARGTGDFQTPEGIRVCPALELLRGLV